MANASPPVVLMAGVRWPPETFIERLARGLAASGLRVQVVVGGRSRGDRRLGPESAPFDVIDLPSRLGWPLLFLKKLITHPFELMRVMRTQNWRRLLPFVGLRPSVLHFQWNSAAIHFEDLFDLLPCPAIVSCRGSQVLVAPHNPKRASMMPSLRRTLDRAARIHCVSDDIRHEALTYGGRAEHATVIRPAVDPEFFSPCEPAVALQPHGTGDRPLRIITIGSLTWRKDHESALVAFSELVKSGVAATLHICGDGPGRQAIEFTAADLGIDHLVRLSGRISPLECRDALREADVFLLSSLAEGISNAALEAMACGLPVVTTRCGGMEEAVRDGIDGVVVPLRDPGAMAAALAGLAVNDAARRRMGASARQRVLDTFTIDRQVREFRTLYAAAMGDGR